MTKFLPQVVCIDHMAVFGHQLQPHSFVVVEPSLVLPLVFVQHGKNPLLVLRVELPIDDWYVAVIELIRGVAHEILVEYDAFGFYFVLFLEVVVRDEGFSQVVGA